jgi:hypothetical protein
MKKLTAALLLGMLVGFNLGCSSGGDVEQPAAAPTPQETEENEMVGDVPNE